MFEKKKTRNRTNKLKEIIQNKSTNTEEQTTSSPSNKQINQKTDVPKLKTPPSRTLKLQANTNDQKTQNSNEKQKKLKINNNTPKTEESVKPKDNRKSPRSNQNQKKSENNQTKISHPLLAKGNDTPKIEESATPNDNKKSPRSNQNQKKAKNDNHSKISHPLLAKDNYTKIEETSKPKDNKKSPRSNQNQKKSENNYSKISHPLLAKGNDTPKIEETSKPKDNKKSPRSNQHQKKSENNPKITHPLLAKGNDTPKTEESAKPKDNKKLPRSNQHQKKSENNPKITHPLLAKDNDTPKKDQSPQSSTKIIDLKNSHSKKDAPALESTTQFQNPQRELSKKEIFQAKKKLQTKKTKKMVDPLFSKDTHTLEKNDTIFKEEIQQSTNSLQNVGGTPEIASPTEQQVVEEENLSKGELRKRKKEIRKQKKELKAEKKRVQKQKKPKLEESNNSSNSNQVVEEIQENTENIDLKRVIKIEDKLYILMMEEEVKNNFFFLFFYFFFQNPNPHFLKKEIHLSGKFFLRVFYGCALISGHYFNHNENYHRVDSPCVVPSLHVGSTKKLNIQNFKDFLQNEKSEHSKNLQEHAIKNGVDLDKIGCVLCLKEIKEKENQRVILGKSIYSPSKKSILFKSELEEIYIRNKFSSRIVPLDWFEKAKTILEHPCPTAFVTGESHINYSFLSGFLCNYFLNKFPYIALIDANVKDVLLNLPFTINLSVVRKPIINCFSSEDLYTEKSFFFGNENPLNNIEYFSQLVLQCLSIYKQKYSNIPLVVNLPSWINGDGYEKFISFFKSFSPAFVVNLNSKVVDINVESSLESKLDSFKNFFTVESYEEFQDIFNDSPSLRRKYQLMNYFSSFKSYSVPFSQINVGVFDKNVAPSEFFRSLNGSLVALLVDYTQYEISNAINFLEKKEGENDSTMSESLIYQANRLPKFLEEIPFADSNLVGFAIISSVNINDGVFNVLSPLPYSHISFVNTFLMGDLHLPIEILISNLDLLSENTPYITSGLMKGPTNVSLFKKGSSKRKMYGHINFESKKHSSQRKN